MKLTLKRFEALVILESLDILYDQHSSLYNDALEAKDKQQIRRVLHTMLAIEEIQGEINLKLK
jgi:hypothetical protein